MRTLALAALLAFASAGAGSAPQAPVRGGHFVCATIAYSALDIIVKNERGEQIYHGTDLDVRQRPWLKVTHDGSLYTVTVNREGYEAQTVRNIKVKYDECGPAVPSRVVVQLKRAAIPPTNTRPGSPPQPVLVEFGGLLWVQSADGLPYLKNGQILAPLLPLCDLFGAKCTPDWAKGTVQVQRKGQPVSTASITEMNGRGATNLAFVNLKDMSWLLGYSVTWLPDARRANVERVRKIPGGLSQTQGEVAGLKLKPTRLKAPAEVRFQPLKGEPGFEELFLSSPTRDLGRLWPFFPNGRQSAASCIGSDLRVCRVNHYDKSYLWTLGYVELKESAWK